MSGASGASSGIAKVLVVGDVATGKTSVIKRYVRNSFSDDYHTTIGVDFALKRVHANDQDINVQLWDIAGQERFSGLSRIFYTHAVAAIIVYDIFQRDSFESTAKWKKDIDHKVFLPSGAHIPVLLLGNKGDLVSENMPPAVSDEEVARFAQEHHFFAHFQVSAKTGANIREACQDLVAQIAQNLVLEKKRLEEQKETENNASNHADQPIKLGGSNDRPPQSSSSSSGGGGGGGCCS